MSERCAAVSERCATVEGGDVPVAIDRHSTTGPHSDRSVLLMPQCTRRSISKIASGTPLTKDGHLNWAIMREEARYTQYMTPLVTNKSRGLECDTEVL